VAATAAAATVPLPVTGNKASLPMTLDQLENLIVRKALDREDGLQPEGLLTQLEGLLVRQALERTRGNKQAAANLLGIYRPRLYSMIKKHDLREYM
jgi:DNA-binding NtrC family response regulator